MTKLSVAAVAIGAAALLSVLACAGSRGVVHVGQPQVHVRERLIPERQNRSEWLRKELRDSETDQPSFQGFRDVRMFEGVFASLRASVDPAKGDLAEIEAENEELRRKAEQWHLKKSLLEAKRDYNDATTTSVGGDPATAPDASSSSTPIQIATPPATTGRFSSDLELASAGEAETTRAQAHPLERFRDKLAIRNAIEAELRQSQFDDAHDVMGGTLYEFTLDVAVVPGSWTSEFAEIEVEVVPPCLHARADELALLYDLWYSEVLAAIYGEIEHLVLKSDSVGAPGVQSQDAQLTPTFSAEPAVSSDNANIEWLSWYIITRIGPTLALSDRMRELHDRARAPGETLATREALEREVRALGPKLFELTQNSAWLVEAENLPETTPRGDISAWAWKVLVVDQNLDPRQPDFTNRLTRALTNPATRRDLVTLCVVHAYQFAFGGILRFELTESGVSASRTTPPPLYVGPLGGEPPERPKPEDFWDGSDQAGRSLVNGYRLFGVDEFVRRLLRAEHMAVQVYAIQPKELAQSLSDVSARESVVDLALAVQAMLASEGVSTEGQFQYLSKVQERLHAVLRQPLVVGFSRGRTAATRARFGWVIGPKFAIQEGRAEFRHAPVRHDVAAEVVAPAWVDRLRLRGRYHWIHPRGGAAAVGDLWNGNEIPVSLPRPDDLYAFLNRALLDERSINRGGNFVTLERRPLPTIDEPLAAKTLLAGKNRSFMVLGNDIWRNPQVFLGHQQADRVEVLSSMKGVVAHFNELDYPGTLPIPTTTAAGVPVRLAVVTSYGNAQAKAEVTILPGPSSVSLPAASVVLKTRSLVAVGTPRLEFEYVRPAAFHRVEARLVDGSLTSVGFGPVNWEGSKLLVDCPVDKWPGGTSARIVNVELRRYDREGQDVGTLVTTENTRLALFPDARSHGVSASGSAGEIVVTFDRTGKVSNPEALRFSFDERLRGPMQWTYPDLLVSTPTSPALVIGSDIELKVGGGSPVGNRIVLQVADDSSLRKAIEPLLERPALEAALVIRSADSKRTEVPIFVGDVKAKIRFVQAPSTAKVALLQSPEFSFRGLTLRPARFRVSGSDAELDIALGQDWQNSLVLTLNSLVFSMTPVASIQQGAFDFLAEIEPSRVQEIAALGASPLDFKVGVRNTDRTIAVEGAKFSYTRKSEASLALKTTEVRRQATGSGYLVVELPAGHQVDLPVAIQGLTLELRLSAGISEAIISAPVEESAGNLVVRFPIPVDHALWTGGVWTGLSSKERAFDVQLRAGATPLKCAPSSVKLVNNIEQ